MPQRLAGIDVANPCDVRLVQQEIFQGSPGPGEQFAQSRRGKLGRECIKPQRCKTGAIIRGFPRMDTAEMAPIRKPQYSLIQFEGDVHMGTVLAPIGASQKILCFGEPQELAIESEVHREQTVVIQMQYHVLSFTIDSSNAPPLRKPRDESSGLGFRRNGMQNVNAANVLPLYQRAECSNHRFYFWELRHWKSGRSRPRLESERMFSRPGLGSVAERRENGFPFVPIGKLIRIVAASRLAGLPGG
jgi:hypothetical protein